MLKWAENVGLKMNFGREVRARQIEDVISHPALVDQIRAGLHRTHIPYEAMVQTVVPKLEADSTGKPTGLFVFDYDEKPAR
ncbi:MAG: hypothetical protein ACJ8R9_19125 [Steroidobacteraceae bacterium]